MAETIIPPRRREEFFNQDGTFTLRALRFFELLTDTSNSTVINVENTVDALTSTSSRVSRNSAKINALELKEFEVIEVTGDFTTERNQILVCKNTSPINVTLDTNAVEGDEVHIKRRNAKITVIGIIDGLINKVINVKNYSMHIVFDGIDWSEI